MGNGSTKQVESSRFSVLLLLLLLLLLMLLTKLIRRFTEVECALEVRMQGRN
jgi:hypothetical protein